MLEQRIEIPVIEATQVSEAQRLATLPHYLGRYMVQFESAVYTHMSRLCESYEGGYWQFYTLSNDGFYMAMDSSKKIMVRQGSNYFEQLLSADTAGIIACLALNDLVWKYEGEKDIYKLYELFEALRAYALEHEDSTAIFKAIN